MNIQYIEKLNNISTLIFNIMEELDTLHNEFILNMNTNNLSSEERIKQKQLRIDKKIQEIFTPLIQYYQIILQNNI
jgi:hypothetical protein